MLKSQNSIKMRTPEHIIFYIKNLIVSKLNFRIIFTLLILILASIYYFYKLSNGTFSIFYRTRFGLVFNDMLFRMCRGDFSINPKYIDDEAYFYHGKTYAYWGPVPAILRFPFRFIFDLSRQQISVLMCLIAATSTAVVNSATALVAAKRHSTLVYLCLAVTLCFAGTPTLFVGSPVIFNEPVLWSGLLVALYVNGVIGRIATKRPFPLARLAVVAGACVLTRVSTALGLCAATTGLVVHQAVFAWRCNGNLSSRMKGLQFVLAQLLILASFCLCAGIINYLRWENPFEFMDLAKQKLQIAVAPDHLVHLRTQGSINPERLWFGLAYYFLPIWGLFNPSINVWIAGHLDGVERPFTSIALTDFPVFIMSVLGVRYAFRRSKLFSIGSKVKIIVISFALPSIMILMNIYMALRYRIEFEALLHFTAFFVLMRSYRNFPTAGLTSRAIVVLATVLAIGVSQWTLARQKPWSDMYWYNSYQQD